MDWDDLRVVLALAEHGSLAAAGAELGVHHTTVSRRVRGLEDRLGVRAFLKTDDGWVLTPSGEELRAAALDMQQRVHDVERTLRSRELELKGTVRLSTVETVALLHAGELAAFQAAHPGVTLEITTDNALVDLGQREADVVLRYAASPGDHLVGRRLADAAYALYGHRRLLGGDVDVDESGHTMPPLAGLPWLGWDHRYRPPLITAWMNKHVPDAWVAARTDSTVMMTELVARGVGVYFLPCVLGDTLPDVSRLRPIEPGFEMTLWLLTHPDLRRSPSIRAFMRYFAEHFEVWKPAYAGTGAAPAQAA